MTCFRLQNGETLRRYCIRTGNSYHTMVSRINTMGITPDQAVKLSPIKPKGIHKAFGEPLKKVCRDTDQNYESVLYHMKRYCCTPELALERVSFMRYWNERREQELKEQAELDRIEEMRRTAKDIEDECTTDDDVD